MGMRVHTVLRARNPPGTCSRCGTVLVAGDPYRWFKPRFGPKRVFCIMHYPKASEMTSSDKLARLYAAREEIQDADGLEAIITALEDAITTAEEVGSEYEQSLMNLPEGIQQSSTGESIQEKIDACSAWQALLEACKEEVESAEELTPGLLERVAEEAEALEL